VEILDEFAQLAEQGFGFTRAHPGRLDADEQRARCFGPGFLGRDHRGVACKGVACGMGLGLDKSRLAAGRQEITMGGEWSCTAARGVHDGAMPAVHGLRSPYDKVGRLVYFGRMLDKIRLRAAGKLPPDYVPNYGDARPTLFDARCCRFLGISHAGLAARTREGGTDEEILAWAHERGGARSDHDCVVWNQYMIKLGWRDEAADRLQGRVAELGLAGRGVETFFDLIEADEGRDPAAGRRWAGV
jgi:gluconokinase